MDNDIEMLPGSALYGTLTGYWHPVATGYTAAPPSVLSRCPQCSAAVEIVWKHLHIEWHQKLGW